MSPIIFGHRGASGYAPENTISAFRMAQKMGSHGLEFDVQLTKDGVPVVIHDETLDRTTDLKGQVSTYNWKQIQKADAGSWLDTRWSGEHIPSLEEVLREFSDLLLNIELKNSIVTYPGLEEKVLTLIRKYCQIDNVIVSSFNHQSLLKVKKLEPLIKTGILYEEEPTDAVHYSLQLGANAVHPDFRLLTKEKTAAFHERGLFVNTWTVNERVDVEKMIRIGVDGIITNYPDRVLSLLA